MKVLAIVAAAVGLISMSACGGKSTQRPTVPLDSPPSNHATATDPPAAAAAPRERAPVPEPVEPAPAPAPAVVVDPALAASLSTMLVMLNALADAVDRGGADCRKVADGMGQVLDANQPLVEDMRRMGADPKLVEQSEAWAKDHMDQLMRPAMKIANVAQTCANDPTFAATMQRLQALQ